MSSEAKTTTDREEIRQWVEERGGKGGRFTKARVIDYYIRVARFSASSP